MSFSPLNHNPLAQLVELKSRITAVGDESLELSLKVELGIFSEDVEVDGATLSIKIHEASLHLGLEGLEVVDGTKFGQGKPTPSLTSNISVDRVEKNATEAATTNEISGNIEVSPLALGGKLGASLSHKTSSTQASDVTTRESITRTHRTVKKVGADSWRITDVDGKPLDDDYLSLEDDLCRLQIKGIRPNAVSTELQVLVKERNMHIACTRDSRPIFSRTSDSREKLIKLLLSKGLHAGASTEKYSGVIRFSRSQNTDEG